eukprot:1253189-Amphidinium_carterae.1
MYSVQYSRESWNPSDKWSVIYGCNEPIPTKNPTQAKDTLVTTLFTNPKRLTTVLATQKMILYFKVGGGDRNNFVSGNCFGNCNCNKQMPGKTHVGNYL